VRVRVGRQLWAAAAAKRAGPRGDRLLAEPASPPRPVHGIAQGPATCIRHSRLSLCQTTTASAGPSSSTFDNLASPAPSSPACSVVVVAVGGGDGMDPSASARFSASMASSVLGPQVGSSTGARPDARSSAASPVAGRSERSMWSHWGTSSSTSLPCGLRWRRWRRGASRARRTGQPAWQRRWQGTASRLRGREGGRTRFLRSVMREWNSW
jgi:hypothetical protein